MSSSSTKKKVSRSLRCQSKIVARLIPCKNGVNIIVHVNNRELSSESITSTNSSMCSLFRTRVLSHSVVCVFCAFHSSCVCWHVTRHFTLKISLENVFAEFKSPIDRSIYFHWWTRRFTRNILSNFVCCGFLLHIHFSRSAAVVVVAAAVLRLLLLTVSTLKSQTAMYNHKWTQTKLEHFEHEWKKAATRQTKQQHNGSRRHHISKKSWQPQQQMCSVCMYYFY